jgi:predicted ArsR family transcriptional regulator
MTNPTPDARRDGLSPDERAVLGALLGVPVGRTASEVAEALGVATTAVTPHLARLRYAGLVRHNSFDDRWKAR